MAVPLPIELFRCPRTGGTLRAETNGTWTGPEGDHYPEVDGLRSFVQKADGTADSVAEFYSSLSRDNSSAARSVAYLSQDHFRRTQGAVKRMMGSVEGCRILDVGCGNGVMSCSLIRHNHVVGIDLTPPLLHRAAEAGLEVFIADATRLPFQPGVFDHVMCVNLIQILPDPQALIRSLDEATRSGGEVLITSNNGESLVRRVFRILLNTGLFRPAGIPVENYPKNPSLSQMKAWLRGTGLDVVEIGATFAPTPIFRRGRALGLIARLLADSYYVRLRKAAR